MATVTFSAADDVLYAYLAGEIDHDAAQGLRIQLDDAAAGCSPSARPQYGQGAPHECRDRPD